ncbi:acyl-CoA/sterol acyltransferase [Acrodontium crateriforme]|uniref:Acyl-CoA/sterol acyltransferase n=1 Tax=Acrodontium crateriforme TaxID=150365 RepID=A0AAQ3MBV0_9PEZI|nr:acyl-CoA/sterol acyltransferase [Acrodontium crateriforme]
MIILKTSVPSTPSALRRESMTNEADSHQPSLNFDADTYLSDSLRRDDLVALNEEDKTTPVMDASDNAIESYDDLKLDRDALVGATIDTSFWPSGDGIKKRKSSIQVKLERTDRKGRYVLTANDPEIREILRRGIEREEVQAGNRKPRTRLRDLVFTRQFTTFDRQNPASSESPFFGFFTLFWIAMVLIFIQVSMHNWRDYGSILGTNQIMKLMFSRDVIVLGLTDMVMFFLCFECYFVQLLVVKGYINWDRTGWVVQNIWQSSYLAALVGWTYFREWPWTHTVFAVLHGLVFIMKQHSWSFYNGHLSGIYKQKILLKEKLNQLESMDPLDSPPASPIVEHRSITTSANYVGFADPSISSINRNRSTGLQASTNFTNEKSEVADVASAIESGKPLDKEQMKIFTTIIETEINTLTTELQGKSPDNSNAYPSNLTITGLFEFICLPTLVYELGYPRQESINWLYVAEKTLATFGVLAVMMVISQAFIYPPVAKALALKEAGLTLDQRWREFPFIVSDMLFPLLIEQLLTWYLIWECILNVLAEVTRFADRGFYGAWWNSQTWDQYARDWNRPVHTFLLRHVYHSSISTFHVGRHTATFITFLLSALVHEMVMALLFKKVRGYLFWMQLMQMPLVALSRSTLLKDRAVLGNTIFWLGLFVGPSFLTGLYLVI